MPSVQDIQGLLQQGIGQFTKNGVTDWRGLGTAATDYIRQNNLDPSMVAQAASNINPNYGWDTGKVQNVMDTRDLQSNLQGIINRYTQGGNTDWSGALQEISNYASQNRTDPTMLANAAGNINPDYGWDTNKVLQTMSQFQPQQYGLRPAISTLTNAGRDASGMIRDTSNQVSGLYNQGLQMLQPYQQTGTQANSLQAALTGALGPEAQKKAFADYQYSPGVEWAQKQGEQSVLRNAAAAGGLGGGNTLKALQEFGTGLALQDYGNQFGRLGQVADRGYGAATTGAGLQGQQAGIQSNLGQFAANIPLQTGSQISGLQYQAGRDLSSNIGNTTSSLANLINQQGAGMTDIYGNATNNINSLLQQAYSGDAAAKEQLATLLANVGSQSASQYAGQPIVTGQPTNYLGQLGQIASGVGGAYAGLTYGQNRYATPSTASYLYQNTNPTYYGNYG